ncbi:MAG: amidohydrolase family protein [Actinobacteria bacterium]|nr:amidohydrolase family protein [Actinomycetota bacterium]
MKDTLLKPLTNEDLEIFKKEFEDFLPYEIIDSHVHLWERDIFVKTITKERLDQNPALDSEIVDGFRIEDFKKFVKEAFPGKKYEGIFFGLPVKEADLDICNKYVSDACKKSDSYGLFNPTADLKEIPSGFFKDRFIGFKPYPDLVDYKAPEDFSKLNIDVSMFDFISRTVFEFCQEYGLILLIHIPRAGRLNDRRNIEEIKTMGKKYPNIKIILAHAGRSYCYSDINESIKYLKEIKNLYVDTAMINSFSVNKVLLEELGPDRLLYGSDLPIALLKGKNIDINNRHYFVTATPKTWSLSSSKMDLNSFTYFIYEIIRALKISVRSLNLGKRDVENIFYGNCNNMIKEIKGNF